MTGLVYLIHNPVTHKFYVGQTRKSLSIRWGQHKSSAKRGSSFPLHSAIRKYGADSFEIYAIGQAESIPHLDQMEQAVIELFESNHRDSGYNLTAGGQGTPRHKMSLQSRQKMSLSRTGKTFSSEHRANIGLGQTKRYQNPLEREKTRASKMGDRNPFFGKTHSAELKQQRSESIKGALNPNFGKKHSEETRQKCREAAQRQWKTIRAAQEIQNAITN